jgi:hypothetical protein
VRKRISLLIAALMLALSMSFGGVAFAQGQGLTETKTNGGGHTPNGEANGVPTVTTNKAGHEPGGHNK